MIGALNAIALGVLVLAPSVRAEYCYRDNNGFERCSPYSLGARIATGIVLTVAFLLFLPYNASPYVGYPQNGAGPQYPPQTYTGNGGYGYDPSAGFAAVTVGSPAAVWCGSVCTAAGSSAGEGRQGVRLSFDCPFQLSDMCVPEDCIVICTFIPPVSVLPVLTLCH
ncbi:hypothetical protein OE88DRAFT_927381 [Heliocybe sulcata]|uniref:Uncharacterized protein n=1 Tax=Heliocybe sulcata TaxID=5364 RepID=A0A5C3MLN0_9AGAM|nr:hypothetical protein OE88DRAFT_927381 [Heliocybe sulcata]